MARRGALSVAEEWGRTHPYVGPPPQTIDDLIDCLSGDMRLAWDEGNFVAFDHFKELAGDILAIKAKLKPRQYKTWEDSLRAAARRLGCL